MQSVSAPHAAHVCLDALGGADSGWHCHPFQVADYNEMVAEPFRLQPPDSVCVLVLNDSRLFQGQFKPWCVRKYGAVTSVVELQKLVRDPIDTFCIERLQQATKLLESELGTSPIHLMHDFSATAHRRPLVLMPTAGHAAGAAYYYRPEECIDGEVRRKLVEWGVEKEGKAPTPPIDGAEKLAELISQFNTTWQDNLWRSCVPSAPPYDSQQQKYFETLPKDRWRILAKWIGLNPDSDIDPNLKMTEKGDTIEDKNTGVDENVTNGAMAINAS